MNATTSDSGTILVVDDSQATIGVVRTALEAAGYQVLVATSGEKALRRVALLPPDLILLDIMMPGMDGYETCRRLKAEEAVRDVPIIFLSALTETFDKVKGLALGAVDYLSKPIAPEEMLARVQAHLTINRLGRELGAANRCLEERVAERTKELSRVNAALQAEIAEHSLAEEKLRRANRALTMLSACNQAVAHATEETVLLDEVRRIIVEIGGYPLARVILAPERATVAGRPPAGTSLPADGPGAIEGAWTDRGCPAAEAICSGEPHLVKDVRSDPNFAPWREEAIRRGYAACVALPLCAEDGVIGALTVCAPVEDAFDDQEVAVLEQLASDLAFGVVSMRGRAERVRAERELQAIIDNTTAVVYAKNLRGEYILINRRFEELFHVRKQEIFGATDYAYFPTPIADVFRANDRRVLDTGAPIEVEELAQHDDGPHVYISSKFPLRTPDGAVYAVCGISTDITERKRAEQERIRLVEELRAAVAARNEFLAVAAHELRTPLTPLVLHVQHFKKLMAKDDVSAVPLAAVDRVAEAIEKQVARLAKLVEHLLDASSLASGKLRLELADTDLCGVAREAIERARAEITSSGSTVEVDLPEAIVGRWDRLRLGQVVTNLLTNALKYGLKRPISILARHVDGHAVLAVTDHGIGIRKQEQDRIFDPFFRAVPYTSISGFGVGLYVVRQIVEAHGATIRVDSELGEGSTVTIELPLSGPRGELGA